MSTLVTGFLLFEMVAALAPPAQAGGERPNIDRVAVSRDRAGVLTFRIHFASPVITDPDDTVQVAMDTDRNQHTGVDGLEYSLDYTGSARLLTAVDGKPVVSDPPGLRFRREEVGFLGLRSSAMTFSIPASAIGDARRFDFYAFARMDGKLDEAPNPRLLSHGLWTYPRQEARAGFEVETYFDDRDTTPLLGRGEVIALLVVGVLGMGALVATIGWTVERRRQRKSLARRPSHLP
jgi:hypothetical protein